MACISEAEIERLKAEVSLVRLVESSGVTLEKRGADLVGRCPFHDDRTPSLVVTPAKNLWRWWCQTKVGPPGGWRLLTSAAWPNPTTRSAVSTHRLRSSAWW
jgi:DNA primase